MAESVRYHRIRLDMTSPWNYGGETRHTWSVKFSLSGATALDQADFEATAIDLFAPIAALTTNQTYLESATYYESGSSVSALAWTPTVGLYRGTAAAYASQTMVQQLEVCNLCECPVGRNSKGRQVYLRKWVHNAIASAGDPNTTGASTSTDPSLFAKWNTGSGPNSLVPVDPTDGMQGTGWVLNTHLYTHQLRRGNKVYKVPPSNTNDIDTGPAPEL
jgi:hypothetical protein